MYILYFGGSLLQFLLHSLVVTANYILLHKYTLFSIDDKYDCGMFL